MYPHVFRDIQQNKTKTTEIICLLKNILHNNQRFLKTDNNFTVVLV